MIRRTGWVLALAAAVVSVVLAVPLGAGVTGIAQVVSFRAVIALGSVSAAVVVAIVGRFLPRPQRGAFVPLAVVLVLGAAAQTAVLLVRAHTPAIAMSSAERPVDVMVVNTLGRVRPQQLAALVEAEHSQVVALPETSAATAQATAALLADRGIPMQVHTAASIDPWVDGVALLVSPDVGDYPSSVPLAFRHGGLRAEPTGGGPALVAVHPVSPTSLSSMATWRDETREAADACARTPGAIVAGDLNATLDHPALRHLGPCVDVAAAVGRSAAGTWPASAPTWLATPIDHVLVDGRVWRPVSFRVLPATGGSDHRPVVARIVARGAEPTPAAGQ